jgi:AcrR family transcriptional regulator
VARPKGETGRRLRDAALALFYDRGYDAASVSDIVAVAGVTPPTLYHHFGSKEGLLRAVVDPLLEDLDDLTTRASTLVSGAESRRGILQEYLEVLLRWRTVVCFVVDDPAIRHHAEIGVRLQAQHLRLTRVLADHESSAEAMVAAVAALGAVWRPVILIDEEKVVTYSETILGAAVAALETVFP